MVMTTGCAGWGTDSPTDSEEETDSNGEAQAEEDSERAEDGGTETSDDTSSTSEDDTGAEDSPESSDTTSDTSQSDGGSSDESTDETGETEEGGSESSENDIDDAEDDSSQSDGDSTDDESSSDDSQDDTQDSDDSNESNETDGTEETHALTVEVYDSDGNPVEGADVSVVDGYDGTDVADGTTDENGEVTFEVPNGDYEILVTGTEDAQSSANRGTQVQGEDTTYVVDLFDPDDNMYSYSATVQVVDEEGNPVANEPVEVASPPGEEPEEYTTDENGEFTIEFENSSETDVVQHEVVVRDTSETIHVERGEQTETITVSTEDERETHTLTVNAGEVYPVEGVDVTIERHADGATTTKTTDEEGQTTFDVYPGDYTVTGEYNDETYSQEVTVEEDSSVLLDVPLEAPDEVETTLKVVDQNGDPVEGVTVEAMTSIPPYGADVYIQSEPTDENGEVTVTAHAGQSYSIDRIEDADGNSYQVVSVGDGMTLEVDEDGESDEIVVERPTEDAQTSYAVAALSLI